MSIYSVESQGEGMIDTGKRKKKHHWANITVITVADKKYLWMLKSLDESLMRNRILQSLRKSSLKDTIQAETWQTPLNRS